MADRLFTFSTSETLRASNSLATGLKTRHRANSRCLWLLCKANTMSILFPKTRSVDFAKKYAWEYSQAKRQWDISTIREQRRLWWKRKNLVSSAWLLKSTRKEICDWKMCQTFWRSPALQLEPERESQKPKRLLSSPIHFTSDYSNRAVKSTRESTSQ